MKRPNGNNANNNKRRSQSFKNSVVLVYVLYRYVGGGSCFCFSLMGAARNEKNDTSAGEIDSMTVRASVYLSMQTSLAAFSLIPTGSIVV